MPPVLTRHIKKESISNFVINMLCNGVIAWFIFKPQATLALWGEHGFGIDLLVTALLLSLILSAIVIMIHRHKLAKNKIDALLWNANVTSHRLLRLIPSHWLPASLCFAVAGLLLLGLPTFALLYASGFHEMSVLHYSIFKGIWAGLVAAMIIPPVIMVAVGRPN